MCFLNKLVIQTDLYDDVKSKLTYYENTAYLTVFSDGCLFLFDYFFCDL